MHAYSKQQHTHRERETTSNILHLHHHEPIHILDYKFRNAFLMYSPHPNYQQNHCFQNRTGPGGRTVKTGNRDENRFFKPKEPDFLLIP